MGRWKLWFVLLVLLTFYNNSKGFEDSPVIVKTIGSEPDLTPICTNGTNNIITLIVCKIRTERSREECRLLYQYGQDFEHECDSRFTLTAQNQTVFLHLTSLEPVDSGNYTCQCSYPYGTVSLHLNITVEGDGEDGGSSTVVIGAFIFISITGVILGFIHRKIHHRRQTAALTSHPDTETQDIEPYSIFIQRENSLYSAAAVATYANTTNSNVLTHI